MLTDTATVHFLALRLVDKAGPRGISSDAMIAAAVAGSEVPTERYPRDFDDFGRCCEAYLQAPLSLKLAMQPILRVYARHLGAEAA